MRKIQHPSLILGRMYQLLGTSTTHSDLFSQRPNKTIPKKKKRRGGEIPDPRQGNVFQSNNVGVVGNRVILCTLKARKENYSGAK